MKTDVGMSVLVIDDINVPLSFRGHVENVFCIFLRALRIFVYLNVKEFFECGHVFGLLNYGGGLTIWIASVRRKCIFYKNVFVHILYYKLHIKCADRFVYTRNICNVFFFWASSDSQNTLVLR